MKHSVVRFSEIDKVLFRLEAEFYKPEYLLLEKRFKDAPRLLDFSNRIVCGPFGSTIPDDTYTSTGTKVIRPFNIKDYQIEEENIVYVSDNDVQDKKLKIFKKGAIFFSRVGDIKCGVFGADESVTISPNIIAVDIKQNSYNSYFLTLFFNSKYGFLQIMRELKRSAQPTISTERLQILKIPLVSIAYQNYIGDIFEMAQYMRQQADKKYAQVQSLILSELGLIKWQPKHRLTVVKKYSDTEQAGRIDAEYYQPKYEEIISAIKCYAGGWDMLGNVCTTKRGSLISDSFYDETQGIPYIRGADFSNGILNETKVVFINRHFIHKNETKVEENDTVFSLIGSVGATALVTKEFAGAYISNNTGKIRCESLISPVVLQALLCSVIGKMYFEKYKTQTAQPKISDKDIRNFILPILSKELQTTIQQKIIESFALRKQSKHLLECAKRAVEMAIEQGESTAREWLEAETKKL